MLLTEHRQLPTQHIASHPRQLRHGPNSPPFIFVVAYLQNPKSACCAYCCSWNSSCLAIDIVVLVLVRVVVAARQPFNKVHFGRPVRVRPSASDGEKACFREVFSGGMGGGAIAQGAASTIHYTKICDLSSLDTYI